MATLGSIAPATTPPPQNPPPADGLADTNGWDTVYAMRFPDVNAAIERAKSSPASFDQTNDQTRFWGKFGDWQMTGGSGPDIEMSLPIPSASVVSIEGTNAITDATATIHVRLDKYPQAGSTATSGKQSVRVNTTPTTAQPSIAEVKTLVGTGFPDDIVKELARATLESWLRANLGLFAHEFAVVDLALDLGSSNGLGWLMPQEVGFAVAVPIGGTASDGMLGILGKTHGSVPALQPELSPFAIPNGARAGFLIAPSLVITNLIQPALPLLFDGATWRDFELSADGRTISNNKVLKLQKWQMQHEDPVQAECAKGAFRLTLDTDNVAITFNNLTYPDWLGSTVYLSFDSKSSLGLDANHGITLTALEQHHVGSVVVSPTEHWLSLAIAISLIVAAAILGAVTDGAADVAVEGTAGATEVSEGTAAINEMTVTVENEAGADLIADADQPGDALSVSAKEATAAAEGDESFAATARGWWGRIWPKLKAGMKATCQPSVIVPSAVLMLSPQILTWEALADEQDLPKLDDVATTAMLPITWPGSTGTTLTSADFNGSMRIGVDPGFPTTGGRS